VAKTEAIQELYTTLEGKQMQVMRLEKLVKLLEDQQDRAQAQRTRLEHRIAQLEVSLREKSRSDSNRYVMRKYLRKPRSSTNDRLPRAFSCESKRAFLEASTPYQYFSRHVPPTKSLDSPPRKFHFNDWYRASSDKEAFICEQCRREVNEKFRRDVIHHVENRRIGGSLYGWLMDSSALETFGEPTSRLNKFYGELSFEEDADCFADEIVNSIVVRDNAKGCNKKSRHEHYCRHHSHLPR